VSANNTLHTRLVRVPDVKATVPIWQKDANNAAHVTSKIIQSIWRCRRRRRRYEN